RLRHVLLAEAARLDLLPRRPEPARDGVAADHARGQQRQRHGRYSAIVNRPRLTMSGHTGPTFTPWSFMVMVPRRPSKFLSPLQHRERRSRSASRSSVLFVTPLPSMQALATNISSYMAMA